MVKGADSPSKKSVENPTALERHSSESMAASMLHCKGAKSSISGIAEEEVNRAAAISSNINKFEACIWDLFIFSIDIVVRVFWNQNCKVCF